MEWRTILMGQWGHLATSTHRDFSSHLLLFSTALTHTFLLLLPPSLGQQHSSLSGLVHVTQIQLSSPNPEADRGRVGS